MQVENHKEEVPFAHYEALFGALKPQAVCTRLPDVAWDGECFTLRLLGRDFAIAHPAYAIRALDGGAVPPLPTQTLCWKEPIILPLSPRMSKRHWIFM